MKDSPAAHQASPSGKFPSLEEVCLSNPPAPVIETHPSAPAIHPAAVYACQDLQQADSILGARIPGYAYQRDGHPNADRLAEKCRQLHHAQQAAITSSGMAALSAIVLSQLQAGDHVLVSNQLYGRSSVLLLDELQRLQVTASLFVPNDLASVRQAIVPGRTRLLFVETIANPLLRIADLPGMIALGQEHHFQVAVDNTFATPYFCRPLEMGADWVWESYSKMLNGHSDLMLGMLCGRNDHWSRVPKVIAAWGLAAAPFECYLAERGLTTFGVRMDAASSNAMRAAWFLQMPVNRPRLKAVHFPGLPDHPDREALQRCFYRQRWIETSEVASSQDVDITLAHLPQESVVNEQNANRSQGDSPASGSMAADANRVFAAGNVVSFELSGGVAAVEAFMRGSKIEYFPSLGECNTTLSHPQTSSHRQMTDPQRAALGIYPGTIRLCLGIEPWPIIRKKIIAGLSETQAQAQS